MATLTVKGAAATPAQITTANVLLGVARQLNAGTLASTAMIYASIWESGLTQGGPRNSSGYGGALAAGSTYQTNDTAGMARGFLLGGKGFGGGSGIGAIQRAKSTSNIVQIAVETEVPSIWPNNAYASEGGYPGDTAAAAEAAAWVTGAKIPGGTAGLGGTGTGTNAAQTSGFQVGSTSNPTEDFWTAINRLSQERYWYPGSTFLALPTPDGWTTLGEIEVGDFVFGTDGSAVRVTYVFPIEYDRDCFRVVFRDGTSVVVAGDHLWTTTCGTCSTRDIATSVTRSRSGSKYPRYNHRIESADPLDLPQAELPIDPYIFGYWLGDGGHKVPRITVGIRDRSHLVAELSRAKLTITNEWQVEGGSSQIQLATKKWSHRGGMHDLLRSLGVFGNKHIPITYLRASWDQRIALLQGLMDSDGWIANKSCAFGNVNIHLADGVLELLRTLGLRPHRTVRKGGRSIKMPQGHFSVARDIVQIKFGMPEFCPFRLPRKVKQYQLVRSCLKFQRERYHTIVAVEPVPSEPVRCIEVDSPDHLFLIGESMVPTHNCFSDGETLYLSDGPDLMNQTPVATIDRIGNRDRINSLNFTWDNTAWQYTHSHKKRLRIQRKSTLAKVTSPVEAQLNYICKIDDVRAGDLIVMTGCGPGDGKWLVGDCRRSVFSVYSEITLVPALAALSEDAIAGTNAGNVPGTPSGLKGNYASPFTSKRAHERVDAGVDFGEPAMSPGDQILAIGDCYCRFIVPNWWAGQPMMAFELTDKSAGYWGWYVAEQITPRVGVSGTLLKGGTIVATFAQSGTGIEIGWADTLAASGGHGTAAAAEGDGSAVPSKAGSNFLSFLQKVGATTTP